MARTDRRLPRRLLQLYAGLLLYGFSLALLVEADLGLAPWDVLHQGLSLVTGLSIGTWVVLMSVVVLLLWLPLRQRPGLGTVSNAVLVGVGLDVSLALLPTFEGLPLRVLALAVGVGLNAVATAAYIGARLGPGPRDGLMTGIAARGHSVRLVRTALEATVLVTGWLLGGSVGVGTLVYAVGIGPLVHPLLPALLVPEHPAGEPPAVPGAAAA
ncbi:MAG TPA: hypothetical protein VM433_08820 [Mycobacteriales bacterium]|nr:hypothetical protein [Mycobacteriales bacterium]